MTEIRKSNVAPVPPPSPSPYYDANQLNVRKAICRACQVEYRVPWRIDRAEFICARCADGK